MLEKIPLPIKSKKISKLKKIDVMTEAHFLWGDATACLPGQLSLFMPSLSLSTQLLCPQSPVPRISYPPTPPTPPPDLLSVHWPFTLCQPSVVLTEP